MKELTKPTKLTWSDGHGEYSIQLDYTGHSMEDVIEKLIKPMLLVVGFQPETIERYLEGED